MKTTWELIEDYLISIKPSYDDIKLQDYSLDGSIIRVIFSYCEHYEMKEDLSLLDYITWIYNTK